MVFISKQRWLPLASTRQERFAQLFQDDVGSRTALQSFLYELELPAVFFHLYLGSKKQGARISETETFRKAKGSAFFCGRSSKVPTVNMKTTSQNQLSIVSWGHPMVRVVVLPSTCRRSGSQLWNMWSHWPQFSTCSLLCCEATHFLRHFRWKRRLGVAEEWQIMIFLFWILSDFSLNCPRLLRHKKMAGFQSNSNYGPLKILHSQSSWLEVLALVRSKHEAEIDIGTDWTVRCWEVFWWLVWSSFCSKWKSVWWYYLRLFPENVLGVAAEFKHLFAGWKMIVVNKMIWYSTPGLAQRPVVFIELAKAGLLSHFKQKTRGTTNPRNLVEFKHRLTVYILQLISNSNTTFFSNLMSDSILRWLRGSWIWSTATATLCTCRCSWTLRTSGGGRISFPVISSTSFTAPGQQLRVVSDQQFSLVASSPWLQIVRRRLKVPLFHRSPRFFGDASRDRGSDEGPDVVAFAATGSFGIPGDGEIGARAMATGNLLEHDRIVRVMVDGRIWEDMVKEVLLQTFKLVVFHSNKQFMFIPDLCLKWTVQNVWMFWDPNRARTLKAKRPPSARTASTCWKGRLLGRQNGRSLDTIGVKHGKAWCLPPSSHRNWCHHGWPVRSEIWGHHLDEAGALRAEAGARTRFQRRRSATGCGAEILAESGAHRVIQGERFSKLGQDYFEP